MQPMLLLFLLLLSPPLMHGHPPAAPPLQIHLLFLPPPPHSPETLLSHLSSQPSPPPPTPPLSYTISLPPATSLPPLDAHISTSLELSASIYAHGPSVANNFSTLLSSSLPTSPTTYTLLLYQPATLAPQRGYTAEPGGRVSTIALSTTHRFALLDLTARPYFFQQPDLTPGEHLLSSAHDPHLYATRLHEIVASIFAPPFSTRITRFPMHSRLFFQLHEVDVSAVIGRRKGIAGDSNANVDMALTFDQHTFAHVMNDVLGSAVIAGRQVQVAVHRVALGEGGERKVEMAVARAFQMKGLEMVLDGASLRADLIGARAEPSVDESMVAHIPMYLFSFADDSRVVHFGKVGTQENVRAMVAGGGVFMVENRLKDRVEEVYMGVTSEAVKEVLEMLGGVGRDLLGYMDGRRGAVPLVVRDVMKRNVARSEMEWSREMAVRKAEDVLKFEGLDERLIAHDKGSAIEKGRVEVSVALEAVYDAWGEAMEDERMFGKIEAASVVLMEKSRDLATKLHDEICNEPLPEEILLQAEAGVQHGQTARRKEGGGWFWYCVWHVLVPLAGGVGSGVWRHWRQRRREKARGDALGEIPIVSPRHEFEAPPSGLWFSTLTGGDKPKVH